MSSCLVPGESARFRSMRAALFIPCFIDQLFPNVGIAMITVRNFYPELPGKATKTTAHTCEFAEFLVKKLE